MAEKKKTTKKKTAGVGKAKLDAAYQKGLDKARNLRANMKTERLQMKLAGIGGTVAGVGTGIAVAELNRMGPGTDPAKPDKKGFAAPISFGVAVLGAIVLGMTEGPIGAAIGQALLTAAPAQMTVNTFLKGTGMTDNVTVTVTRKPKPSK